MLLFCAPSVLKFWNRWYLPLSNLLISFFFLRASSFSKLIP